jgi:hypothetical protein
MLLSEIVYNIKNLRAGGIGSDDENVSDRQIAFWVQYYRAKLLKQDQDKGRFEIQSYVQNLGVVPLTTADKNECCEGECILRTELKIPKPLETYKGLNITFVGTANGKPFDKQTHNSVLWNKSAKYTGKEPKWYFQNGYIYLLNPPTKMMSEINIQGIFEDPLEAQQFRTCDCPGNDEDCSGKFPSLDFEFSLPAHHVDTIVKLVAETELRILSSFPSDTSNDSADQVSNIGGNGKR